jgi:hypothetical protein
VLYIKEDVCRAKIAHDFLRNSGYPSMSKAAHLLTDGNIHGIPMLTRGDLEQAYRMYREHPEYVWGQMVKKQKDSRKCEGRCVIESCA